MALTELRKVSGGRRLGGMAGEDGGGIAKRIMENEKMQIAGWIVSRIVLPIQRAWSRSHPLRDGRTAAIATAPPSEYDRQAIRREFLTDGLNDP